MVTREDFIEKLSTWLSKETCEALAFEAEQRFAEDRYTTVYELMLLLIASGDLDDFIDLCDDCDITLRDNDYISCMFEDMTELR